VEQALISKWQMSRIQYGFGLGILIATWIHFPVPRALFVFCDCQRTHRASLPGAWLEAAAGFCPLRHRRRGDGINHDRWTNL